MPACEGKAEATGELQASIGIPRAQRELRQSIESDERWRCKAMSCRNQDTVNPGPGTYPRHIPGNNNRASLRGRPSCVDTANRKHCFSWCERA